MSISSKEKRFGDDGEGDDQHVITMTKLIVSNKILIDLVEDLTDRYLALKTVVAMAHIMPDDIIGYKFVVSAVEKLVTATLTNGMLDSWINQDNDDERE